MIKLNEKNNNIRSAKTDLKSVVQKKKKIEQPEEKKEETNNVEEPIEEPIEESKKENPQTEKKVFRLFKKCN